MPTQSTAPSQKAPTSRPPLPMRRPPWLWIGVGAVVFAAAENPGILILGRALLGLGTAGSLVASLAVYARRFPRDRFATLTGLQIGFGTLGALLATAPLAFSTATIGWRGSFLAVGVCTGLIGLLIALVVRDNGVGFRPELRPGSPNGHFGLQGMRERAERLGGRLEVESTPGRGTTVHAEVPLQPFDDEIA